MRMKSDARRQAIMAAAWEMFREGGFERTTMSEIADRVGGSKATLYSYFKSKEELFAAALEQTMHERADEAFDRLTGTGKLEKRLLEFASSYLEARVAPDMISVDRALIAEAERSDLGEVLREQFVLPHWRRLAAVMEKEMLRGRLYKADPYLAAMHFRGLIEADILEDRLHADRPVTAERVEAAVTDGVEAFLRAYDPSADGPDRTEVHARGKTRLKRSADQAPPTARPGATPG